ncbi:hypothetical protein Tco_0407897 [Tanacetum coccineum]
MKAITTRSGVAYEGPSIPTNHYPKKVVERETEETTDKEQTNFQGSTAHIQPPVIPIPILEPDVYRDFTSLNIPYPSRLNQEKLREKSNAQMMKFLEIFQKIHFDMSFADALLYMPKIASQFLLSKASDKAWRPILSRMLGFTISQDWQSHFYAPLIATSFPSLTLYEGGDFILEEIENCLSNGSIPPGINDEDFDPEGDICLIEKLLNNDPFQLPPMDLKQVEVTKNKRAKKSSMKDPPELELKDYHLI